MSHELNEYEVGYKKPPKKSQFKKGKSGNPKGRPPKKDFHQAFIDALNEEIMLLLNGQKTKLTVKEALLKKMLFEAVAGKQAATKNVIEIMKSLSVMPPI